MDVIYVSGFGRSGSSVVDAMLASQTGALEAGELCHLYLWASEGRACSCGLPVRSCAWWGPVIDQVVDQLGQDVATLASASEVAERGGPDAAWREIWQATFDALGSIHSCSRVVDSSKTAGDRQRLRLLGDTPPDRGASQRAPGPCVGRGHVQLPQGRQPPARERRRGTPAAPRAARPQRVVGGEQVGDPPGRRCRAHHLASLRGARGPRAPPADARRGRSRRHLPPVLGPCHRRQPSAARSDRPDLPSGSRLAQPATRSLAGAGRRRRADLHAHPNRSQTAAPQGHAGARH